jgi:hypothetical protein
VEADLTSSHLRTIWNNLNRNLVRSSLIKTFL